jgi:hypothetical protein
MRLSLMHRLILAVLVILIVFLLHYSGVWRYGYHPLMSAFSGGGL